MGIFLRTNRQNNYYWKCIVKILGQDLGYHQYEMHKILKNMFIPDSTKELSTQEFHHYCEEIRIWSQTELGIVLPLPEKKNK